MTEEEYLAHPRKPYTKIGKFPSDIPIPEGMKGCPICVKPLPIDSFPRNIRCKDGRARYCKNCAYDRHQKPNRERKAYLVRKWKKDNPDNLRLITHRSKKKAKNPNKIKRIREKLRMFIDDHKRIDMTKVVNCNGDEFTRHIESKFYGDISWANYGHSTWHIDHIIPQLAFNFELESHIKWCWDYRNLQPLTVADNAKKGNRLPTGESGVRLKKLDPYRFHCIVGQSLEHLRIVSKEEYFKSVNLKLEPGGEIFPDLFREVGSSC